MIPQKQLKRTLEDSTSSDDDTVPKRKSDHWSRFLVISSSDDGPLKLNPFALSKAIYGIAGDVVSMKKMRFGCIQPEHADIQH